MAAAATTSGIPQFASLYVGDIHSDVTEAMLYEIFNNVGPVASIRVCRDSVTRRSLGYSYVNFHSVSDAERAIDTLNYTPIKGRACRIMWSQRDPSLRKSGVGNVFVKNLDPNIDNKALYDTFSLFGNILTCKVVTDPAGKSRGYGFVHYETEEAAKQAIERVNGMQIGDKTVNVAAFVKKSGRSTIDTENYSNIYVKCFPAEWDDEKLKSEFASFGTITSCCVMTDKKSRKFAFVAFEDKASAKAAVEGMHKKDMRTPEQKAEMEGKPEDEIPKEQDGWPSHILYAQRAESKQERQMNLREKFSAADQAAGKSSGKGDKHQGVNLYIKNLDDTTTDESLRALFETFGTITSASIAKDADGKCKGFGFACFASPDEATKAVTEMHLKVIKGKPLYVGLAEKRAAREERLRQRYSPSAGGMDSMKGGKGGMKGGKGGGMPPNMYGQQGGMMGGMQGMYFGGMGGKGMQGPQGMMYPPQANGGMFGPRGPMMGAGARPMVGNPQMMGMMGGKGGQAPSMGMGPMGGKGMGPMGMMGGMPGMGGMMPGMGGPGVMPGMRPPMNAQQMQQMQMQQMQMPQMPQIIRPPGQSQAWGPGNQW
eukprot:gnl/TRDRNA2_/TRDRNA2_173959_c2_seq36.p1 gnl/TRDRNA2_/TRDRNA2_173959_c2~~gnl/TRDRNA2_/TRDRNA2_173959_c2_seq36.p1  ORF type:complete len:596 (-),score=169.90 gnl/TRDRNA2_/TRDRNA2_173959_c2_seq36:62-1849(-)